MDYDRCFQSHSNSISNVLIICPVAVCSYSRCSVPAINAVVPRLPLLEHILLRIWVYLVHFASFFSDSKSILPEAEKRISEMGGAHSSTEELNTILSRGRT